ncbi:hypothetical protein PMI05_01364 [Brevibacillus sp. BC25]|nr:hypothetical protein PMI05_01364 [Brevibacillus sp. BC25]
MIFVKKCRKLILSFALIILVIFSGQTISLAADEYTENLVPKLTSNDSAAPIIVSA